jgi:hypothetical protein
VITSVDDPPCWGMNGTPLLPPEWWLCVKGELRAATEHRRPTAFIRANLLCKEFWADRLDWKAPPYQVAAGVAEEMFDTHRACTDVPILTGRFRDHNAWDGLPLFTSTWQAIRDVGTTSLELELLLTGATFLELYQRFGSATVALDLGMTARSWSHPRTGGSLELVAAREPSSVAEAFQLAQLRHVMQAGATNKHSSPSTRWPEMLAGRAGISPTGSLTLDQAGRLGGVTRERVRQVEGRYCLQGLSPRRWPMGSFLAGLRASIEGSIGATVESFEERLAEYAPPDIPLTLAGAQSLLSAFGVEVDVEIRSGHLRAGKRTDSFASGVTHHQVRKLAWEMSGKTGLIRRIDVLRELLLLHPNADPEELGAVIDETARITGLPLGYLLVSTNKLPTVIATATRMLQWAHQLTPDQLRRGLERRFRHRKLPPPPPVAVLEQLFAELPDFIVEDGVVRLAQWTPPERETHVGWIFEQIRSSGLGVIHRTVLLDAARAASRKQSSVSVYATFGEIFEPVGRGCIAIIGDRVEPFQVEFATEAARAIRIPDRVISEATTAGQLRMKVQVGSSLRDTGVLAVRRAIANRFGDRRLVVHAADESRGTVAVSGTSLYGLITAFGALDVVPGDVVDIVFDFEGSVAHVGYPSEDEE